MFLKGLYDLNLPYKFVVSGSGSLDLKEKIVESLAGRKRIFALRPLDFWEFLDCKTDYKYAGRLDEFLRVERAVGQKLLAEYLSFGGYPKVVLAQTIEEKSATITDIYESYLSKDISSLLRLKKPRGLLIWFGSSLHKWVGSSTTEPFHLLLDYHK